MESLATAFARLRNNYMFATACYVLYLWDHILTFPAEVDKMWSQRLTLASLLFYLNRYVTHGQFIVLQVAFYETTWSVECVLAVDFSYTFMFQGQSLLPRCERYVLFPGAATMSLVAIAEMTLILRVYALYRNNKFILAFLAAMLCTQIILMAWALHFGVRVPLPPGFPGCVLTGNNTWFGAFWAAPIATDTCIFVLTLWRTVRYQRKHGKMNYMHILLRDGIMYFFIIFSVNLINCIIYFRAPPDMKAAGASFSQIMTAIMISRLHLNLRDGKSSTSNATELPGMEFAVRPGGGGGVQSSTFNTFFTTGNLGGEMEGTIFDVEWDEQKEDVWAVAPPDADEMSDGHTIFSHAEGIELSTVQ